MNFEAVIGIEIHVEMKTKSKMFSSSPNYFGASPNTLVSPLDMAFPGTMPTVNKQAVINAIRVSNLLNMEIDHTLYFDRKNYFYSDLPKGYQITQNDRPIGKNGYVIIDSLDGKKKIEIERLHMEEDTCKQLHLSTYTLLDYNRAGTPLIEIVSRPDIKNGYEAMKYVDKIREIVVFSNVSDGKMEEGSLRCDVNISLRPVGESKFGTKVEIKNLNSVSNVQKAIDFEIRRQSGILLSGGIISQETRRFDETKKETVLMRKKTDSVDYKYFREPNIAPIYLSDEFVQKAIDTCLPSLDQKRDYYLSLGLNIDEANQVLLSFEMSNYFDKLIEGKKYVKTLWNLLMCEVLSYLNKNEIEINDFIVTPSNLVTLASLIDSGEISFNQGKKIFQEMVKNDDDPRKIQEALGLKQNSNLGDIESFCKEAIKNNPQSISDYKNGKDRAFSFLVGQVMKLSKGKVNPQLVSKVMKELIDKE